MNYETVIGLEVHVELATQSKIFCGCTTAFGGAPNTHVCPVCAGMPGSLPVLNRQAVEYALRAGVALHCHINRSNQFDRKNYFYPDLPKAYQISQLYYPICQNGYLEINHGAKRIGIHEIHLEEDAGKLIHDPWEDCSLIDYNRCGVPLIEIVSEPDFRNADEVIAYLEKLREILLYLEISDCKLQEGSMRADVNLSVRPFDGPYGVRTEMKNLNSFKSIARAIHYEGMRQIETLEEGGRVIQETRRWDDNKDASYAMRSKENAQDYRYFPEPDLPPLLVSQEWIEHIIENLPETAEEKRQRYISMGLTAYDAQVITAERPIALLFERTCAICQNPKETANLITGEILRLVKETSTPNLSVDPQKLATLICLITSGAVNRNVGKKVLEAIVKDDADPETYIAIHGLGMIQDTSAIASAVDQAINENPKSVEDYQKGKEKAFRFLVGQTMKALQGRGDPDIVNQLLQQRLSAKNELTTPTKA